MQKREKNGDILTKKRKAGRGAERSDGGEE